MLLNLLTLCSGYLIGSIPTGFIIARLYGIKDIRAHGSGNIGATNVARVLGYKFFFLIFFLDALKAFGFLFFLSWFGFSNESIIFASCALLLGNAFSIFLSGKGGKGIATLCGILLFIKPNIFFLFVFAWLCFLLLFKNIGIASIGACIVLPIFAWYVGYIYWKVFIGISLFIIVLHKNNIKRFIQNFSEK